MGREADNFQEEISKSVEPRACTRRKRKRLHSIRIVTEGNVSGQSGNAGETELRWKREEEQEDPRWVRWHRGELEKPNPLGPTGQMSNHIGSKSSKLSDFITQKRALEKTLTIFAPRDEQVKNRRGRGRGGDTD